MKQKKKEYAYISYFQSSIIIFLQNRQIYKIVKAILMKLITCSHRPSTLFCHSNLLAPQFSIFEPPYPASYCTHINTLITIKWLAFVCEFQLAEVFSWFRI